MYSTCTVHCSSNYTALLCIHLYSLFVLQLFRTCNGNHLQLFLSNPDNYAGDLAHNILPPPNARPQRKSEIELKEKFPVQYELKGFCPVTYIDGKQRYIVHVHV